MEDQLKNSMAELDIARQHLSTAKSNESKMKKFGIENENLRKLLGSSESRISDLEEKLKTVSQTNEVKDSQLERLQDELQQLKKKQEQKEKQMKTEDLDCKEDVVYEEPEVRSRDDVRHTVDESTDKEESITNNVKQLLQELSSGIVRYSGWIILSVALVYCTGPISVKSITELVSH